jgi:hypothetical protein
LESGEQGVASELQVTQHRFGGSGGFHGSVKDTDGLPNTDSLTVAAR